MTGRRFFRSPAALPYGKLARMKAPQNAVVSISEPKPELAKCLNCGTEFIRNRKWRKFCTVNCRTDYYWKTHKVVKIKAQLIK